MFWELLRVLRSCTSTLSRRHIRQPTACLASGGGVIVMEWAAMRIKTSSLQFEGKPLLVRARILPWESSIQTGSYKVVAPEVDETTAPLPRAASFSKEKESAEFGLVQGKPC